MERVTPKYVILKLKNMMNSGSTLISTNVFLRNDCFKFVSILFHSSKKINYYRFYTDCLNKRKEKPLGRTDRC